MMRRTFSICVVATIVVAAMAVQAADPDPPNPISYDPAILTVLLNFFKLVSHQDCYQWASTYWTPDGTFYHPKFPVASGTASLNSTCYAVQASMDLDFSTFRQSGPIHLTTTGTGTNRIMHLLVPYYFATSPNVFINTGYEYLQLVPNVISSNPPYLIKEATEYFQRLETQPFNWTSYGDTSDVSSTAIERELWRFVAGLYNPSIESSCDNWANNLFFGGGSFRGMFTTEQADALQTNGDLKNFCVSQRGGTSAPHTDVRLNGGYLVHQSGGYSHVLVPYTGTLYQTPGGGSMSSRVGFFALIITPPSGADPVNAPQNILRATNFLVTQQVPFPAPSGSGGGNNNGGDCDPKSGYLSPGTAAGVAVFCVVASAIITFFIARSIYSKQSGGSVNSNGTTEPSRPYSQM